MAERARADLAFVASIPDEDLETVFAALKSGAREPGEALGFGPPELSAVEGHALGYYRARRHGEAATLYGFVLRMSASRATAWRGLGACAHALKSYERASACYRRALDADPGDVVARVLLGESLCLLGRRAEGLALLRAVSDAGAKDATLAPYVARARAIIGARGGMPPRLVVGREGTGRAGEATDSASDEGAGFHPSRPLAPDDLLQIPALRPLLADLAGAVAAGRLTYAEVGGFTAKELDGAYAVACRYAELGQVLQAIQIAGVAMFLDPWHARYPQLIGICLQRMRQYGPADYFYGLASSFAPGDPRTLVYRGEAKIMAGEVDAGLALVRDGVAAAGTSPEQRELATRGAVLLNRFAR